MDGAIKPGFGLWYEPLIPFCSNVKILRLNVRYDLESLRHQVAIRSHPSLESLTLVDPVTDPGKLSLDVNFPNLLGLICYMVYRFQFSSTCTSLWWDSGKYTHFHKWSWSNSDQEQAIEMLLLNCPNLHTFAGLGSICQAQDTMPFSNAIGLKCEQFILCMKSV